MPADTRSTPTHAPILVVGVGNDDRGDDAVGLLVARQIAGRNLPGVAVLTEQREGTALVSAWEDYAPSVCVVIDALASGQASGTRVRLEVTSQDFSTGEFLASTHGIGLAQAIELGRALGVLPPRLVLYLVEGAQYGLGAALSPAVAAVLDSVADEICLEIVSQSP